LVADEAKGRSEERMDGAREENTEQADAMVNANDFSTMDVHRLILNNSLD
jgi:hypothetical protein